MAWKTFSHIWRSIATLLGVYFVLLGLSYLETPEELDITQIGPLYTYAHSDYVRAVFSFLIAFILFIFAIDPYVFHKLRNKL